MTCNEKALKLCTERCTTLKPFLFVRGTKHYARFFIPTAYREQFKGQKYLVVALGAGEGHVIRKKASTIENELLEKFQKMGIDWKNIRTYEIDLPKGIARADGPEDHQRMIEALSIMRESFKEVHSFQPASAGDPLKRESWAGPPSSKSLTLLELLDKYFLLKKLKPATVGAHKITVTEFSKFLQSKAYISEIMPSDITRYQEYLATEKKNTARTIDSKIGHIKTVLNFGIAQSYLNGKNPAAGKSLLTKRQKLTEGYLIFELEEIKNIFTGSYFLEQKKSNPDYYFTLMLALFTGCRVSELTSICKAQIKKSEKGTHFITIRDSKTNAGKREIPIPNEIFDNGFSEFISKKSQIDNIFKYVSRDGKGSGNAVGKKFSRHLKLEKIERGKLVFHSIRKFLNDYFMKNGIEFEMRCQFFGHEIESVNVATYTKKFGIDQLNEEINPIQQKILRLINQ